MKITSKNPVKEITIDSHTMLKSIIGDCSYVLVHSLVDGWLVTNDLERNVTSICFGKIGGSGDDEHYVEEPVKVLQHGDSVKTYALQPTVFFCQ